jgi:hypothetical protein
MTGWMSGEPMPSRSYHAHLWEANLSEIQDVALKFVQFRRQKQLRNTDIALARSVDAAVERLRSLSA